MLAIGIRFRSRTSGCGTERTGKDLGVRVNVHRPSQSPVLLAREPEQSNEAERLTEGRDGSAGGLGKGMVLYRIPRNIIH